MARLKRCCVFESLLAAFMGCFSTAPARPFYATTEDPAFTSTENWKHFPQAALIIAFRATTGMYAHINAGHTPLLHFISSVYFTGQGLFVCQPFIYGDLPQHCIRICIEMICCRADATGISHNCELHFCSAFCGYEVGCEEKGWLMAHLNHHQCKAPARVMLGCHFVTECLPHFSWGQGLYCSWSSTGLVTPAVPEMCPTLRAVDSKLGTAL